MGKSYHRERLNESIKALLAGLLLNGVKDPRVGLVSITAVEVSPDRSVAKVYYTVMGQETDREESRKGLLSARNFLRKTVGRELKMRTAPELIFLYDEALDRSFRIEETLSRLKDEEGDDDA